MSGDADYASVSLLLHCDGTDGSTTFTDNSPSPKTVTAYGTAALKTAQKQYGSASLWINADTNYAKVTAHADLDFGSGDFTWEAWVYRDAVNSGSYGDALWCSSAGPVGFAVSISPTGHIGISASSTGTWDLYKGCDPGDPVGSAALALDTWYHIAVTRSGDTWRGFVNGVLDQSFTKAGTISAAPGGYNIGRWHDEVNRCVNGYLDDIRVTKGTARYTADFTPPTEAFPDYGTNVGQLALAAYAPYLPGQIEAVMFGLQAFGLQSAPILAPTTGLALGAYPVLLDNALAPAAVLVTDYAPAALSAYPVALEGVILPAAIELRHLLLTPWVMPMTSPVYPPAVEVTLLPPPPGVSIRGLWSPADVLFGWGFNSGTDTISFPLASLFELTAAQADPVTGDWRAILLALVNSLWDAYIELDTPPQAMVLEYNPGYMMTVGPMVNTVRAEYNATTYLTFPDKFIADEP